MHFRYCLFALTNHAVYEVCHTHTHAVEDHYNSNVQLRRTARVDAGVAGDLQKAEVDRYRAEEEVRRRELGEK